MKKILATAFACGLIVASCGKKEDESKETNVMLQEPKIEIVDSTAAIKPTDNVSVKKDSLNMKADTTTAK